MRFQTNYFNVVLLSQPQLNHNSTQPNITKVGFDTKMTLHQDPRPPHHHHQKLNIINISAFTDPILTKL